VAASGLGPRFEAATGHRLATARGASMDNAPDAIPQRLNRAEPADVFILARSALDALVRAGHVRPGSEVDLVHSGEFRHALLNAQSIACSASASGVYISTELFQHLGIAEQAAPRARRILSERVGSVVARGEAEIGFQQLSELLPIPGIEIVGPLPGPIQRVTTFSAGIATRAEQPKAASALIRHLAAPASHAMMRGAGLDPAWPKAPTSWLMAAEHRLARGAMAGAELRHAHGHEPQAMDQGQAARSARWSA